MDGAREAGREPPEQRERRGVGGCHDLQHQLRALLTAVEEEEEEEEGLAGRALGRGLRAGLRGGGGRGRPSRSGLK